MKVDMPLNKETDHFGIYHYDSYLDLSEWVVGFMVYQSLLGYLMSKSVFLEAVIWFQIICKSFAKKS